MRRLVRTPEISELRSLCAAAETGSLGRAALRLQISQPALSKRLAGLEQLAGVALLERSPRGVSLTPEGRRLYEEAQRLLAVADGVADMLAGLPVRTVPVRLAASHSSCEAFVADVLADESRFAIELVAANSSVVRGLVADGRADLGVAASRPGGTPNPAIRELPLADDAIVCAVPPGHPWSRLPRISIPEFLKTPMVVRDPASNARWTVDTELRRRGLEAAAPLCEVATPAAAKREAIERTAPLLLSDRVLHEPTWSRVSVDGLAFPRRYAIVLPGVGDPAGDARALIERLKAAV
ncbi:MAG TPA: LysR family transcriptional regulator [Solirubrobacteraceae bacterium]|nr:LysR family transcriptional regulator [Solirubrobacteraceae bacterium]